MTKIAFVADVHLANHRRYPGHVESGINGRARLVLDTIEWSAKEARSRDCSAYAVLGDLFDTAKPTPQIIRAAQKALTMAGRNVILLLGNHDQVSDQDGDHALGPMTPMADVVDVDDVVPVGGADLVMVPFRPGKADEWFPEAVKALETKESNGERILCLHLGIRDEETPYYLANAEDSISADMLFDVMEHHGIKYAAAGNWHEQRMWQADGMTIHQVGTLCPTGFDNPGLTDYGFMSVWDSETGVFEPIHVPGPRFVKARTEEEFERAMAYHVRSDVDPHCTCFVEYVGPKFTEAAAQILEYRDEGWIADGAAYPDKKEEGKKAAKAAKAASSAENLDKALGAYIEEMPLDEGVDRKEVLAHVRAYLKR